MSVSSLIFSWWVGEVIGLLIMWAIAKFLYWFLFVRPEKNKHK